MLVLTLERHGVDWYPNSSTPGLVRVELDVWYGG
jgi:hypothetical protein